MEVSSLAYVGADTTAPTPEALAAALHQRVASSHEDAPLHRRVLRFILSPLARLQRGSDQQQIQRQEEDASSDLQDDMLCGCSEDGTEFSGEDVLGSSPFASCADLQDYRRMLAERRDARAAQLQRRRARDAARQRELERAARPGPLRRLLQWAVRGARAAGRCVSPQGAGNNDATLGERIFNVLTSIPFVIVGLHSLRGEGGPARRNFGLSFVATGVIAAVYHASSGGARLVMRKLDYWSIALTSSVLRKATGLGVPPLVNAAAALLTPLKPTLVTGANLAIIEARYLQTAMEHAHLRPSFGAHIGVAATGLGFFMLEDVLVLGMGAPPVVHSLWHLLSTVSLSLVGPLLTHCEAPLLRQGAHLVAAAAR